MEGVVIKESVKSEIQKRLHQNYLNMHRSTLFVYWAMYKVLPKDLVSLVASKTNLWAADHQFLFEKLNKN